MVKSKMAEYLGLMALIITNLLENKQGLNK